MNGPILAGVAAVASVMHIVLRHGVDEPDFDPPPALVSRLGDMPARVLRAFVGGLPSRRDGRRDDLPLADALGYGLVVLESEQLIVSAGANQGDLAVFQDSPAGDSATAGGADPLDLLHDDPDADGSGGVDGVYFGLAPIESPFKRLLNGGNDIEFYRCLAVGERCGVIGP